LSALDIRIIARTLSYDPQKVRLHAVEITVDSDTRPCGLRAEETVREGAQSTLGRQPRQGNFARKYVHEKAAKCLNFTRYLPKNSSRLFFEEGEGVKGEQMSPTPMEEK